MNITYLYNRMLWWMRGSDNADITMRTFNVTLFFSVALSFTGTFINWYLGLHPYNLLITITCMVVYSVLFFFSRFIQYHTVFNGLYMLFTQGMLSFAWFINAGSQGTILPIMLGALAFYIAMSHKRYHVHITLFVCVNVILLHIIEWKYPHLLISYTDTAERYTDLIFTHSALILMLGVSIHIFKESYEKVFNQNERNLLLAKEAKNQFLMRKMVENSMDAIITTTYNGVVVEWNKSAEKIFGYKNSEAIGCELAQLIIPKELHTNFNNAVAFFIEKTNFMRFETSGINKRNIQFPIELSMTLIDYPTENLLNFFIRDISERREYEEKIVTKNKQLEQLYNEMDTFIYRASHDLRAPVTNVMGLTEILADLTAEEQLEVTDKIKQNTDRLLHILENLSNYSKNHQTDLQWEKVDLLALVGNIKNSLESIAYQKNLDIKVAGNTTEFFSDKERLKIILTNLIENAIVFCKPETSIIKIEVQITVNQDWVEIILSDNGEGIKPEVLPKIFNMFYRGSVRSTGAGLGLYVVKRIVNKMNGHIQAKSEYGVGTEFTLTLPNFALQESKVQANVF